MSHPTIPRYYTMEGFQDGEGTLESTEFFINQDEEARATELSKIRTEVAKRNLEGRPTYLCGCCHKPLKICGGGAGSLKRYHFRHFIPNDECEFKEGKTYTKDELARMTHNGRQEGPEHRRIKMIFFDLLSKEFDEKNVHVEERIPMEGRHWRKPDINVDTSHGNVAFEVQLAPISLYDIILRNKAYRTRGRYIVWIFNDFLKFQDTRFWQRDASSQNIDNFFIFDEDAEKKSSQEGCLYLKIWFYHSYLNRGKLEQKWIWALRPYYDLTFDEERQLIYFIDCEKRKEETIEREKKLKDSPLKVDKEINEEGVQCETAEVIEEKQPVYATTKSIERPVERAFIDPDPIEALEDAKYFIAEYNNNVDIMSTDLADAFSLLRNLNHSIQNFPDDYWMLVDPDEFGKYRDKLSSTIGWMLYQLSINKDTICGRITYIDWSRINPLTELSPENAEMNLSSLLKLNYRLTESDANTCANGVGKLLRNEVTSTRKNAYKLYLKMLVVNYIDSHKDELKCDAHELKHFVVNKFQFLSYLYSIRYGVNITNFQNYAQMASEIAAHYPECSSILKNIMERLKLNVSFKSKKGIDHYQRILRLASELTAPKEAREMAGILLLKDEFAPARFIERT